MEQLLYKNRIIAEFTEANMVIIKHLTETGTSIKTVEFTDFCKSVIAASKEEQDKTAETVISPIFPVAKNVYTIQHVKVSNGTEWFVMIREAGPFNVQYYDTLFKQVGIPKLVFAVKILKNTIQEARVLCVTDPVITENTKMYNFPFSNSSCTTGKICFGGNRMATFDIKEPAMLHSVPNMFLSMTSNDDSYGNNHSDLKHRQLLELLEGDQFPNEWLKSTGQTYKQWVERMF